MVNELLNRYIDQNEMLCVQRTRSILDCIKSTWMWTHDEPLNMNEVHLFLCDEHSGRLSDEQKEFVRACRNWVQEQLENQAFLRFLQDEDLRKNVANFCKEHCKGSAMQSWQGFARCTACEPLCAAFAGKPGKHPPRQFWGKMSPYFKVPTLG